MRFPSRILFVVALLVFVLALTACSSPAASQAPVADEQTANTPIPPAAPAVAVEATAAPAAPAPQSASDTITFAVDAAQSEARFVINEVLMGSPKTVVGVNSGVSGQVTVNPAAPTGLEIDMSLSFRMMMKRVR